MAEQASFIDRLSARFAGAKVIVVEPRGEVTLEVPAAEWHATALALRDEFGFEQAVDLCGVDYLGYGSDEWDTADVSSQGFSRGVEGKAQGRFAWGEFPTEENGADGARPQHMPTQRFAVVAQLRSYQHNLMMHLRCFAPDEALPVVSSLTSVWPGLNWFEREAFDLYGVIFEGHPDLRRILTDYGFVGHPFRKDFPLIGNVEVRYDEEKKRVIYEPVTSVEPRVGERLPERAELLPRVRLHLGVHRGAAVRALERLADELRELTRINGAEREADVAGRDRPGAREDPHAQRERVVVPRALGRAVLGGGVLALHHLQAEVGVAQVGEPPGVRQALADDGLEGVDQLDGDRGRHGPPLSSDYS